MRACVCAHTKGAPGPSTTEQLSAALTLQTSVPMLHLAEVLPAMPSNPHPAHLHDQTTLDTHCSLGSHPPPAVLSVQISLLPSHTESGAPSSGHSGSSAPLPPLHTGLCSYRLCSPSHTLWPTHRSVFRTQLPHTGIRVCSLPRLVMGVERESTLRSDSEGRVRCRDAGRYRA